MYWVRLIYSARGALRWASHLDIIAELARWMRRAGLDLSFTRGYNPKPRMRYSPPKPVGISSLSDALDVRLNGYAPLDDFEIDTSLAGLKDGRVDLDGMTFEYPGQLPSGSSNALDANDLAAELVSRTPDWWLNKPGECLINEELRAINARLLARAHPSIELRSIRALPPDEKKLPGVVESALFRIILSCEDERSLDGALDWLCGEKWIVPTGKERVEKNVRDLVINVEIITGKDRVALFLKALSQPSATFPVMPVIGKLTDEYSLTALAAARWALLDARDEVIE